MENILITGISGQDGVFLTSEILKNNPTHNIYGITRQKNKEVFFGKLNTISSTDNQKVKLLNIDLNNLHETSKLIEDIRSIIKENGVKGIIVGNPINMDGSYGKSSQSAKDIAINLADKINIPVCLWDERLSTVGAFNLSSELDINVSKREKDIDKFAAAFILQGALDYLQN